MPSPKTTESTYYEAIMSTLSETVKMITIHVIRGAAKWMFVVFGRRCFKFKPVCQK